jgi:hypothetical protein
MVGNRACSNEIVLTQVIYAWASKQDTESENQLKIAAFNI